MIGLKFMCSDELMVDKLSYHTTVYQCAHCQWAIAVDRVDLDRDIGGPPEISCFKGPLGFTFPSWIVYQLVQGFQILTQLPQSLVVHLSLTYLW